MSFLLNVWFQKKKKKKNREKKRKKETPYSLDKLRLSFNDFFFSFSWLMKEHGIHNVKLQTTTGRYDADEE